jgi:hypothetical protein
MSIGGCTRGDSAERFESPLEGGAARFWRRGEEPSPPRQPLGGMRKGDRIPSVSSGLTTPRPCDILFAVPRRLSKPKREPSDAEVRETLVRAMADVGADPALVYAFQKTGVYVCDENEKRLSKEKLKAFDGAVDEYLAAIKRPPQ